MGLIEQISDRVEQLLPGNHFLVDVIIKGTTQQKVLVLIDGDNGITIDNCASLSRQLSSWLEEEDLINGKYLLEVSSPGLDHPLKNVRQYKKNIGRTLRVTTTDDKVVEGKLEKVAEGGFTLVVKPESKQKTEEDVLFSFEDIEKTMVLVSFN